jgi:hypothetical protein
MSFLKRKVNLSNTLRPYDSTGNGLNDMLVTSAATKTIQIPIIQQFDDMGTYEVDDDETFVVIDLASLLDEAGTGVQPPPLFVPTGSTWGTGGNNTGGTVEIFGGYVFYCDDPSALGYSVPGCDTTEDGSGPCGPHNYLQPYNTNGATGPKQWYPALQPSPLVQTQPAMHFSVKTSLCVYASPVPPPFPPPPPQIKYNGESHGTNSDVCTWIDAVDSTDAWNQYKATAEANAQADCVSKGYTYLNTVANSLLATPNFDVDDGGQAGATCANWSAGSGNIIGVQLNGSETGYCCEDNIFQENNTSPNPTITKRGFTTPIGTPIPTSITYPSYASTSYTTTNQSLYFGVIGTNISWVGPPPTLYDKAQTLSNTPCQGLNTIDYYDCRRVWSQNARISGPVIKSPSFSCGPTSDCSLFCPCTRSTVPISNVIGLLPDYASMAGQGTVNNNTPGFPCVHVSKKWRVTYCYQCQG